MAPTLDVFILKQAFFSFFFFIFLHLVLIRLVRQEGALKKIRLAFALSCLVNLFGGICYLKSSRGGLLGLSGPMALFSQILATLIFGLLSFLYILSFFGPYHTSLRLRLLRELGSVYPKGLTSAEILNRYNVEMILKKRLNQLTASGELIENGGLYRVAKKNNAFFLIYYCADTLETMMKK